MIYKATLILSLLFLTLSGSAQSDIGGTLAGSGHPSSALSSTPQTVAPTQSCPSGPPISLPTASDNGGSSRAHGHNTRPSDCQPNSVISTMPTGSLQQPPSGVLSSAVPDSSLASMPAVPTMISGCQPYIIPTGTENVPPFSGRPSASSTLVSKPPHITTTISLNGTQPGNSTPPSTASSQSVSGSASVQQDPPISTSHVGRRRLVRRQV